MGHRTYIDYVGIKVHFNVEDFIWNADKPRVISLTTFKKRKDRIMFSRLEDEIKDRDKRVSLIVSGMLYSKNTWIGDLLNSDEISEYHNSRMKKLSYLKSLFKMDCDAIEYHLYENNETLTTQTYPNIMLTLFRKKKISLETLSILDYFNDWATSWKPSNPLHKEKRLQITKYKYLLSINDAKIESSINLSIIG